MTDSPAIDPLIKDLTEAASTAAKVMNRYWLVVISASLFVLLPRPQAQGTPTAIVLPFSLGELEAGYFAIVSGLLLSVVTTAFCSAHAQLIRVQRLIYRIFDTQTSQPLMNSHLDPRDIFDALRLPALQRVAPLAQVARGKYQFFQDRNTCPRWLVWSTGIYYVVLKIISLLVFLGVPAVALVVAGIRLAHAVAPGVWPQSIPWSGVQVVVWLFVVTAVLALLQTGIAEFIHVAIAIRAIVKRPKVEAEKTANQAL